MVYSNFTPYFVSFSLAIWDQFLTKYCKVGRNNIKVTQNEKPSNDTICAASQKLCKLQPSNIPY